MSAATHKPRRRARPAAPPQLVAHSTFAIERSYPVSVERVFAAFSDPATKRRWFAEKDESEIEEHEMDFRVGGRDRMVSRFKPGSPFPGMALINDTTYQDIVPARRIVVAYTMTVGDRRFSASLATFEFVPQGGSTNLVFTEQAAFFEGADGPEIRRQGWSQLLNQLGKVLARRKS